MYTIKQAAARSGVPVQLLRAWERRYGVVEPTRASSGYRLYDEVAIARLRAMRTLMDEGWAPSTAAAHIRELDGAAIAEILGRSAIDQGARRSASASGDPEQLSDAFVVSAGRLDESAVEQVLDDMFARGTFEQVTTDLVMPALVALGDGWAQGKLDVAAEHAASGAVQRRLGLAFMAAGVPDKGDNLVLVGMPPGARHDLGALAFATAARRAGVTVRFLGPDLPVEDWIEAVVRTSPRAVVVGVVIATDVEPATEVARAIRAAAPTVLIALGGRHGTSVPLTDLEPVTVLPADVSDSVFALTSAFG